MGLNCFFFVRFKFSRTIVTDKAALCLSLLSFLIHDLFFCMYTLFFVLRQKNSPFEKWHLHWKSLAFFLHLSACGVARCFLIVCLPLMVVYFILRANFSWQEFLSTHFLKLVCEICVHVDMLYSQEMPVCETVVVKKTKLQNVYEFHVPHLAMGKW